MIRSYTSSDKPQLLNLLRLNTPEYFDPGEEKDFVDYLDHELDQYFVYELDSIIVGCGGLNFLKNEKEARISWDMIHPDYQGRGIGRTLTQFRIETAKRNPKVKLIVVRTSQITFPFYEKQGFKLTEVKKDFWAPGFDLYRMEIIL